LTSIGSGTENLQNLGSETLNFRKLTYFTANYPLNLIAI